MATGIWVIAEQKEGKLKKVTLEMLSKAKEMAGGEEVSALLLGSGVEGLAGRSAGGRAPDVSATSATAWPRPSASSAGS